MGRVHQRWEGSVETGRIGLLADSPSQAKADLALPNPPSLSFHSLNHASELAKRLFRDTSHGNDLFPGSLASRSTFVDGPVQRDPPWNGARRKPRYPSVF